jgi:hypothetical protein
MSKQEVRSSCLSFQEPIEKNTSVTIFESICCFLVPLLPIIDSYSVPNFTRLSVAELFLILLLLAAFILLFSTKQTISFPVYLLFFFYWIVCTFVNQVTIFGSSLNSSLVRSIRDLLYMSFFCFVAPYFMHLKKMFHWYKIFSIIACFLLLLELLLHYVFGKTVLFLLPFLPLNYPISSYSQYLEYRAAYPSYRPSSFFLEPSYFAYYISPFLLMLLFSNEKKGKYLLSFFVSLSLAASLSGTALLLLLVIWASFFYLKLPIRKKYKIGFTPIFLVFGVALLLALRGTKFDVFARLQEIFDPTGNSSGSVRIVRGFKIFDTLPFYLKIFGIGAGNVTQYIINNNLTQFLWAASIDQTSLISYIFICSGFLGFALFFFSVYKRCKEGNDIFYVAYFLILSLLFLEENFFLMIFYVFFMSILFCKNDFFLSKANHPEFFLAAHESVADVY